MAFSKRGSSALGMTALRRWHEVYSTHQNAQAFAAHYNSSQLRYKMLLTWRLQLRAKRKQVKVAKTTEKFFITRAAWQQWMEKVTQRRRDRKLKEFENQIVTRFFQGVFCLYGMNRMALIMLTLDWAQRTQLERQRKLAVDVIRQRISLVRHKL